MNNSVLDRWEERLEDIFNNKPYDMLDAALTDTICKFPLDIKVPKFSISPVEKKLTFYSMLMQSFRVYDV